MRIFGFMKKLKLIINNESGTSFIETVVALSIASAVVVAFLSGLATTARVVMISEERTFAEDLAKSQLEFIQVQDYISADEYNVNDPDNSYQLIEFSPDLVDGGYSIEINPPETIISTSGDEIYEVQKVTVVVKRQDEVLLTVSDNKISGAT
jgi:Tfp pilus assembly protein PilV